MDLVLIPYHGQPNKDEREIRRGRAKQGTTHFHCYASAYIILKNKRYTLALTYVWGDERLGEVLTRLAELYGVSGVGVDISPYCVADVKQKLQERVSDARIEILNMDGADYKADQFFDLAMCIGASWVYKGHRGTLRALKPMTKPGGLVLVGEPFWIKEPEKAYLAAENHTRDMFGTHYENVLAGEEEGLVPLYTMVSNQDDWDRYETLQWYAAAMHAGENEDDPDVPEILARVALGRTNYLRWGRNTLGWALYLFRNSGPH